MRNRGAILSHLDRDVAKAALDGSHVAVVMADIDFFKSVNDRFGHPTGDAVPREVAGRLSSGVRAGDAIGRYGGEEFLVVLSPTRESGPSRSPNACVSASAQRPSAARAPAAK